MSFALGLPQTPFSIFTKIKAFERAHFFRVWLTPRRRTCDPVLLRPDIELELAKLPLLLDKVLLLFLVPIGVEILQQLIYIKLSRFAKAHLLISH